MNLNEIEFEIKLPVLSLIFNACIIYFAFINGIEWIQMSIAWFYGLWIFMGLFSLYSLSNYNALHISKLIEVYGENPETFDEESIWEILLNIIIILGYIYVGGWLVANLFLINIMISFYAVHKSKKIINAHTN